MGCGEAFIAQALHQKCRDIFSFDLVSPNRFVTVADSAHTPLKSDSIDVCLFCLSLMGTNWLDFIKEAYRVLKMG
jgi:hypothetical protein